MTKVKKKKAKGTKNCVIKRKLKFEYYKTVHKQQFTLKQNKYNKAMPPPPPPTPPIIKINKLNKSKVKNHAN